MTEPQKDWPAMQLAREPGGRPETLTPGKEAKRGSWEYERYIPESALLSDKAVEAAKAALPEPLLPIGGATDDECREYALAVLQAAIKAASER